MNILTFFSAHILTIVLFGLSIIIGFISSRNEKINNLKNSFIFKDFFFYCFLFLILGLLFVVNYYPEYSFFVGDDYAQYLSQANSILNNTLMNLKNDYLKMNEGNSFDIPLFVNWGYCFILAVVQKIVGNAPIYFKLINFLFYFGSIIIFYKISKRYLNKTNAKICSLIISLNFAILPYIGQITPDILVTSFFIYSMYIILKIYEDKETSVKNFIILGLLVFTTYMIKANGALLIGLIVILNIKEFIKEKDFFKFLKRTLPIFIFLFLMLCFSRLIFTDSGYSKDFDTFSLLIVFSNIKKYFFYFINSLDLNTLFFNFPYIEIILGLIFSLFFIIIPFIKKEKFKKFNVIYLFNTIYFISIIVYKYCCLRYIFPILGFVILQFFYFNESNTINENKFKINFINKLLSCWGISISLIYLLFGLILFSSNFNYERNEVFNYIENNTNTNDIFYVRNPRTLYFETGRIGHHIGYIYEDCNLSDEELLNCNDFDEGIGNCDYLLYENRYKDLKDHIILDYYLKDNPNSFEIIYFNEEFILYKRKD